MLEKYSGHRFSSAPGRQGQNCDVLSILYALLYAAILQGVVQHNYLYYIFIITLDDERKV